MFGSRHVLGLASLLLNAAAVAACEEETRPPAPDLEGQDEPAAAGVQPMISPVDSPTEQPAPSTPSGVGSQAPAAPDTGGGPDGSEAAGSNATTTTATSDAVTTANTGNTLTSDTASVTGAGGVDVTSNGGASQTLTGAAVDGGVSDAGMGTDVSGL